MARIVLLGVLLALWGAPATAARLLVSIEPLAMLAEPLLGAGDQLQVLLPANRSPHHYALRASDMRALQAADLVLWVGPELEQFLAKPLAAHPGARALAHLPGLSWPPLGHHHHGGERDPHLWLNPDNGKRITHWLADQLMGLAPERRADIERRRDVALARLATVTQTLERQLAPLAAHAFIAYHPAYGHWNQRFGLRQLEFVALTPEQKPGARHLVALRELAAGASCLVTEAFYANDASAQLAAQLNLPLVVADPMGAQPVLGSYRYEQLLLRLAQSMQQCVPQMAAVQP